MRMVSKEQRRDVKNLHDIFNYALHDVGKRLMNKHLFCKRSLLY